MAIVFPTKNTRFLLGKTQIKMENPGKKKEKRLRRNTKKCLFQIAT